MVILALDGAWRTGAAPQQIVEAIVAKQTKNEGRTWPDWRTADPNKAIEHDRFDESGEAQPSDVKADNQIGYVLAAIQHYGSQKWAERKGLAPTDVLNVRAAWDAVYQKVQALAAQAP